MPNHFHTVLEITVGATLVIAQNITDDIRKGQLQEGQPQGITPTDKMTGDMVGAHEPAIN